MESESPDKPATHPGDGLERPSPSSILVVDDEPEILEVLEPLLRASGYQVDACSSSREALEKLEERTYACLIVDHFMPDILGLDLLAVAQERQPHAARILVTGQPSVEVLLEALNKGEIYRFMEKPWDEQKLLQLVDRAVARYRLQEENTALHRQTEELNRQLEVANTVLKENFQRSIALCQNLMSTFFPLLGECARGVEAICQQFCKAGLLPENEQRVLMVSAALHNIGLIGITRDILAQYFHEPDALSLEDRFMLEKHPVYGATLAGFVGHLEGVAETIRAHHERWDGKGYPDGLREESIPRPARYLAVAAAFVESRLSHTDAVQYVIDEANQAFFPDAVRAFLKVTQAARLPKRVREITLDDLRPGMILARGLHTPTGLLLVPEEQPLSREMVDRIHKHDILDHIQDRLLVYR